VIGDCVLDKYCFVDPRPSIEHGKYGKQIPQFNLLRIDKTLGGCYNVAHLLQNKMLATDVVFYSIVPEQFHNMISENIFHKNLFTKNTSGLFSVKQRYSHYTSFETYCRFDYMVDMGKCTSDDIYSWVKTLNFDSDLVIMSDYMKGMFATKKVIEHIIANSKYTIVDTKNPELEMFFGADYIKLNKSEWNAVQVFRSHSNDVYEYIAPFKTIVTQGIDDTLYMEIDLNSKELSVISIPIEASDPNMVVDAVGCGDAFVAGFAWALLDGNNDIVTSIKEGHKMAKISTSNLGVQWTKSQTL